MNQGTYPLAASMINQINRLDQISNNLANLNTFGFKQEGLSESTFNMYLQKAQNEGITPTKENIVTNNIPKLNSKFVDSALGAFMPSGNDLDFALNDREAFFKVRNNETNDIEYTRDGSFKVSNGFLVDSNGNQILSADNTPIPIEEGNVAAQIGIAQIPFENLEKFGNNNFRLKEGQGALNLANTDGILLQGTIEKSNVNSITAMVELIDAQRRFEQSQKAVTTIDELNGKIIDKIGNNTR